MKLSVRLGKAKLWLLCLILVRPVAAQNAADVLPDAIPVNAIKRGPWVNRDQTKKYFYSILEAPGTHNDPPGAIGEVQRMRRELVGFEIYDHDVLIERTLLKIGKRHGIQSKWYLGGQLKSIEPYRNGVMDGTFKYWDEQGRLVGEYVMQQGKGVRKLYNPQGVLIHEETYENNRRNSWYIEYFAGSAIRSIYTYKSGKMVGPAYDFANDRELRHLGFFTDTGALNGPFMDFSPKAQWLQPKPQPTQFNAGPPQRGFNDNPGGVDKAWYIKGEKVTEAEYAKAAAQDPTLPPYYADAMKYKELIPAEVTALLAHYINLPKVKIPLEFDAQGNPVLAQ